MTKIPSRPGQPASPADKLGILITYATLTGNTQDIAEYIHGALANKFPSKNFSVKNIRHVRPQDLLNFKLVLFGFSSWDDGPSPDTKDFLEKLTNLQVNLSASQIALFCLGDSQYQGFCTALPVVQKALQQKAARVLGPTLTLDGFPDQNLKSQSLQWAELLIKKHAS